MKKRYIIALILPLITAFCADAQSVSQRIAEARKLHRSYDFDGAEAIYDNLLKGSPDSATLASVQELRMLSENGKNMLQFATRPEVAARRTVAANDFFLYYSHFSDGQWVEAPNPFAKEGAKANYIDTSRNSIVFSAPDGNGNLALFSTTAGRNGVWTEPKPVESCACGGDNVYPLVSASGEELYFSSDAMAGMGGFDLYVCKWNVRRRCWGAPENLGFPYSSTGDDFLFSNTPDGNFTIIASNRDCGRDSMTIYALKFVNSPIKQPVTSVAEARRIAALEPLKAAAASERPKPTAAPKMTAPEKARKAALDRLEAMKDEIRELSEVRKKLIGAREISANESHIMDLQRRIGALSDTITMMDIELVALGRQPSYDFAETEPQTCSVQQATTAVYSFFKRAYGTLDGVTVEQPVDDMEKYAFSISDQSVMHDDIPQSGIIYQIQIGVSTSKMKEKQFKGISPAFSRKQASGKYLHCVGAFRTFDEASEALAKVKHKGFSSAYIIAFKDGASLAVSKAKTLE